MTQLKNEYEGYNHIFGDFLSLLRVNGRFSEGFSTQDFPSCHLYPDI